MAPPDVPRTYDGTVVFSNDGSHVLLKTEVFNQMQRRAQEYERLSRLGLVPPICDNDLHLGVSIRPEGEPERLPIEPERSGPSAALAELLPISGKRKVKNACVRCHQARKACDEDRPCRRCVENNYVCAHREPAPRGNGATKLMGGGPQTAFSMYPQIWGETGHEDTMAYANQGAGYMNAGSSATGAANWMGTQHTLNNADGEMYHLLGYEQGYEGFLNN